MRILSWPPFRVLMSALFPRFQEPKEFSHIAGSDRGDRASSEREPERFDGFYWTWSMHGHW